MAETRYKLRSEIHLSGPGLLDGHPIPHRYTKHGANLSPELLWSGLPEETASLALICEDPRGPDGPFALWLLYNIPADLNGIPENLSKLPQPPELPGAAQGENDAGSFGYEGPDPPPGHPPHRYTFTLYALDVPLALAPGADVDTLRHAIDGHVLDAGELTGTLRA
jgi:Raf kinase inhibitor-like YbhB/YbcL family protein